jgi:RND family efflux transporter MFP subunit
MRYSIMTRRFVLVIICVAAASVPLLTILRGRVSVLAQRHHDVGTVAHAVGNPAFIDSRRQQLAGVRLARVTRATMTRPLRAVGVVNYDETRLTDVNSKVHGWVREQYINFIGQRVTAGQALFALDGPDLVSVETQMVAAIRNRDLMAARPSGDQPDYADRLVESPRQRLLRWDVPEDQIQLLEEQRQVLPAVVFRSPASGVVIEKSLLKGMHVEAGKTLYRLADLSVVWVEAEFHESDIPHLRLAESASVSVEAWPHEQFTGRLVHLYPNVSEQTRTVKARIELRNPSQRLMPGMSANVELAAPGREGWSIPRDAVLDSGSRQIVFVAVGEGHFEPRKVTVGDSSDGRVLVLAGLHDGEEVVTRATFMLDSESRLGSALSDYEAASVEPNTSVEPTNIDISIQVSPDPPKAGENVVDVRLRDANGRPVADVDVSARFYMPPMSAMNMPAMQSDIQLAPSKDGEYRGRLTIPMSGRWEVTATALRRGRPIATRRISLVVH